MASRLKTKAASRLKTKVASRFKTKVASHLKTKAASRSHLQEALGESASADDLLQCARVQPGGAVHLRDDVQLSAEFAERVVVDDEAAVDVADRLLHVHHPPATDSDARRAT